MKEYSRTLILLSVFVFLVMLGMTLISPILPLYATAMGASVFMVSLLVAVFALSRMLLDLPAGMLGAKYHPKTLILFGMALVCLSSILCGFARDYWVLLLGRVIEGVGSAFYTTMSTTLLALVVPEKTRGKSMSLYTGMLLLGGIFGPGVGGLIASVWGLQAPFFFYALVVGIGFVLVALMIEKTAVPHNVRPITFNDVRQVVKDPSVMLVNLATLSLFFTRAGLTATVTPLFAYKNLGISEVMLGLTLTCTSLCMFFTMTPSGSYTDKHGRKPSMIAALVLTGAVAAFIPFTQSYLSFVGVMVIYGATLGLSGPISAWLIDLTPKERLGVSMGVFRTVNDAGFVLGPLVLGGIAGATMNDGKISYVPYMVAAIYLFIVGFILIKVRDPVAEGKRPKAASGSLET